MGREGARSFLITAQVEESLDGAAAAVNTGWVWWGRRRLGALLQRRFDAGQALPRLLNKPSRQFAGVVRRLPDGLSKPV